jgi:hypothetical protein
VLRLLPGPRSVMIVESHVPEASSAVASSQAELSIETVPRPKGENLLGSAEQLVGNRTANARWPRLGPHRRDKEQEHATPSRAGPKMLDESDAELTLHGIQMSKLFLSAAGHRSAQRLWP